MGKNMECKAYFIRHTDVLAISDKFLLEQIFMKKKIMVHFPGKDKSGNLTQEDLNSLEPTDYKNKSAQNAIRCFNELAKKGGYVWAQYHIINKIFVGKILPNSKIELIHSTWEKEDKGRPTGSLAIVKSLQLNTVKIIKPYEAMALKAARPRQGTICRWRNKESDLVSLVENYPIKHKWENISPDQQEVICAEFLRNHKYNKIQKMKHLLLPVGRTLKDIDIFGLTIDNKVIFSQVTFLEKNKAKNKIKALRGYLGNNNILIFFCKCDEVKLEDDILFIPIKIVERWLFEDKNKSYKNTIFI